MALYFRKIITVSALENVYFKDSQEKRAAVGRSGAQVFNMRTYSKSKVQLIQKHETKTLVCNVKNEQFVEHIASAMINWETDICLYYNCKIFFNPVSVIYSHQSSLRSVYDLIAVLDSSFVKADHLSTLCLSNYISNIQVQFQHRFSFTMYYSFYCILGCGGGITFHGYQRAILLMFLDLFLFIFI